MGKYCRQHIGKTFNDGKLTVVDGGDKVSYVKVKCSVCAEDSELFGDGIFESNPSHLKEGKLPCGCSKNPRWSLSQYGVKIQRKILADSLPIEFKGFVESAKAPSGTTVRLFCKKSCAEYTVATAHEFLKGSGNFGKLYTISERLDIYNEQNPTRRVWDSRKKVGSHAMCGFHCSICEANGFESLYEIKSSHLFDGVIPCACSGRKQVSYEEVVEITKRKLYEEGIKGISVISAYKKGRYWFPVFLCELHGVYSRDFSSLTAVGCHCTKCNPPRTGYNKANRGYMYLLEIVTSKGLIVGYGITSNFKGRLTTHRKNLKSIGATITNIQVFEGAGTAVLAVENAIKALHPTGLLDCEGFRRESISIDMKDKVLEKCSKLKELDNTNKLI